MIVEGKAVKQAGKQGIAARFAGFQKEVWPRAV
jgi:hypothetical protein